MQFCDGTVLVQSVVRGASSPSCLDRTQMSLAPRPLGGSDGCLQLCPALLRAASSLSLRLRFSRLLSKALFRSPSSVPLWASSPSETPVAHCVLLTGAAGAVEELVLKGPGVRLCPRPSCLGLLHPQSPCRSLVRAALAGLIPSLSSRYLLSVYSMSDAHLLCTGRRPQTKRTPVLTEVPFQ